MSPTNNPIHLAIAPTYLAANDDRDAARYGLDRYVRVYKRWIRRAPGACHLEPGLRVASAAHTYLAR